ncbi:Calcium-binding mitochondrial carrier protein SCaMC-1 [Pseudolycoriella hygida]|uniref:Calcium-binding mitochondrial carrier protein SCaMC-1 n=1 Tax=Pseudolycoriella hygida TaxID=35572 RepID=A0A9Q0N0R4_9DIPT|nr:Calcium-binding mitochondrial carrier protein SCaMC-1 [Pseudolycoriella hygida]
MRTSKRVGYSKRTFLRQSDRDASGDVGLAEFIYYVREHEKNLKLQFSHLDKNQDGKVDLEELISAFKDLGIDMDKTEAKRLLSRMDQDGSLNISYDEWRDFLLLAPSTDIHGLIKFWRHSTPDKGLKHPGDISLVKCQHSLMQKLVLNVLNNIRIAKLRYLDGFFSWKVNRVWQTRAAESDENSELVPHSIKTLCSQYCNKKIDKGVDHFFEVVNHFQYLDIGEDMNIPDDFTPNEMQTGKWWRHLAAGGVAGAVSRTCTAPLDRLKVFLQVQTTKARISDSFMYMLKEGGVRSFWRGNGINVLKIAPETAIKFAAYEQVKRMIRQNESRQMTIYERFVAGACAGVFSQTVIYPFEVLKTRLALRKTGQYKGIADATVKIFQAEGVRSFYRGYIPNLLGIIPYAGIDLAVYETLKKKYLSHHKTEQPSFWLLLGCGSVSSTLGQVCSYPLALVRTRLQAQVISSDAAIKKQHTMVGTFRRIIATEGVSGLYRGITPNFIKVLPAVSISYVVYEYSSRALGVNMT